MRFVITHLVIIFSIIFIQNLYSQNIEFEHLSLRDGLSQSSVTCIEQDSLGFLWFGTYNGLNRFDGYNFKIYLTDPKNQLSISHNFIRCSYVDGHGTLWIGTWGGGLNKVEFVDNNRDSLIFLRFQHNPLDSISLCDDRVSSIQQHKNGMLWIGTRHGISIFDPFQEKFIKRYVPDPNKPNTLSTDNISELNIDDKNNIWIATWGGGLNKYDHEKKQFIVYQNHPNDSESISHDIVLDLLRDSSGNLWIGTWGGGLNKLKYKSITDSDKNTKLRFERFTHDKSDMSSISGNSIYDIYEDRCGVLWFGTDWDGVNKYDPNDDAFKHYHSFIKNDDSGTDDAVYALYKDKTGILWLGTRGNGLISFDMEKGIFKSHIHDQYNSNSISNNVVRSIYEDRAGRFWIGTEIGFNQFDRSTGKFKRYYLDPDDPGLTNIVYIYEDRESNLWLGAWDGGLSKFNTETKKFTLYQNDPENSHSFPDNIVWCITEDLQNQLWIGTDKNGLLKYDREKDQFISFKNDENDPNSISDNKVLTIYVAQNGDIWLGTTTGLNRIAFSESKENKVVFENFPKEIGLFETTILGVMEDKHDNLWICSSNYLTKYNPVTERAKNYHIFDKLHIGEFNVNAVYKDSQKGDMYLGGTNGFNVFNPDSLKNNMIIPKAVITDLKIFGKSIKVNEILDGRIILKSAIAVSDHIQLDYRDDVFSLEFSALHYNAPEFNQYAYILDGFENKWNYVNAKHRIATYTNLDPGQYVFRVKASNNDGMWDETGKNLKIIITPPFWMTWWFRIFAILWTILFIIVVYRLRINQIKKRNLELAEINDRLNDEVRERHRAENEIKLLNIELERRVEHRTEELESFAYAVSHDLRAPLRSMQGFSNELIEGLGNKLEDKHKDYFNRIIAASRYMSRLIDDLLKLSRVTRTNIKKEKINLSNIAEQVAKNLKIMEPERDVKFDIEPNIDAYGDKNLIWLVIENLFSNSWKFSENIRDVVIEFKKITYNGKVTYVVKDNGIGFDMDYVNKLFEPFHRLNIGYTGTGIGLATVRRIIKLHGGIIWAEGEVNVGATFYFTLPG